jgi:hypothetical protein
MSASVPETKAEFYTRVTRNAWHILHSAEGETNFGGADADSHPEQTRTFFDREYAKIGACHPEVNAPLLRMRAQGAELI